VPPVSLYRINTQVGTINGGREICYLVLTRTERRMRRIRGLSAAAAVVVLAGLLAACAGTSARVGTTGSKVTGKIVRGGTVTIAEVAGASPNFLFPYPPATNTNGYNGDLTMGLWPFLAHAGDGGKSAVDPRESLYSSLTYSRHDSVITIVLKPWKWSDGAPITSRDFTFTYNLLKANYTNWVGYSAGLFPADVTRVAAPSAHTVVLDLTRPYNPAFYTDDVLTQITVIPQHAWDKTALTGKVGNYDETTAGAKKVFAFLQKEGGQMSTFATSPLWKVVDGPWRLSAFQSSGYYSYVPNKNYSGPAKPILSKVIWTPFTSDTAEMDTLRSGTSLGLGTLPQNDVRQTGALEADGYTVADLPANGVALIVPNFYNATTGPLIRQLYIRQALEDLINRPQIVSRVYAGYADPGNGPVAMFYGRPWVSPLEKAGGPYPYSPPRAIALLRGHGWKVVPHGITTCAHPGTGASECGAGITAGQRLEFTLVFDSGIATFAQQDAAVQSSEAAAGVRINLKTEPFGTLIATTGACTAASHPAANCGWQLVDYGYDGSQLDPTGIGDYNTNGTGNRGGYSNAEVDQLINETEYGSGPSAFYAYENYTARQLPVLWLPNASYLYVYRKNLAGITPWNPFSGGANPEVWYYTKSRTR
jgi:peptide/nickel transport system substrate-binding protein